MEFIENIGPDEYELFVQNHKSKSHFMQSSYFGEIKKANGYIPILCGLYNEEELVGACLVLKKTKLFGLSFFYIPRGFVIDFSNDLLVEEMTNGIREMAKRHKAIFVCIDPDVELQEINLKGDVIQDLNHNLINRLKDLGYIHKGFNYNFENREPRFTFRLDLNKTKDEIRRNMHDTTRKILNRGNPYDIDIHVGDSSELDKFYFVMDETSKRQHIISFSHDYYKKFYETFHNHDMADLYVAEIDIDSIKLLYTNKINILEDKLSKAKERHIEGLINDFNNQLRKAQKDYDEVKSLASGMRVLASYMTVRYGNKVWTVHGGNANYLRGINANYLVYDKMIMDAKDMEYDLIDFFGTTGQDSPDNPVHGIHLFKSRLGGRYVEFIGEFDLVIKPGMYHIYTKIVPMYHKFVYSIKKLLKGKK